MKERALVTGAGGFIGRNIVFNKQFTTLFNLVACYREPPTIYPLDAEIFVGDLCKSQNLAGLFDGVDSIIHLAGVSITANLSPKERLERIELSMHMTEVFLQELRRSKVRRVLWLSSTTGYPSRSCSLKEEMFFQDRPHHRYAEVGGMFRSLERTLVRRLRDESDINLIVLRPSAVFGEFANLNANAPHVLTSFVTEMLDLQRRTLVKADPVEARDWLYVGDLVNAINLIMLSPIQNTALNIGSGRATSMFDLHRLIVEIFGLQDEVSVEATNLENKDALVRSIDTSLSTSLLGNYSKTSLRHGLERMIDWCINRSDPRMQ